MPRYPTIRSEFPITFVKEGSIAADRCRAIVPMHDGRDDIVRPHKNVISASAFCAWAIHQSHQEMINGDDGSLSLALEDRVPIALSVVTSC